LGWAASSQPAWLTNEYYDNLTGAIEKSTAQAVVSSEEATSVGKAKRNLIIIAEG
jgi:hypothetical protein